MKIQLEYEIGKLYSVPYADGVAHGVLREVQLAGSELKFRLDRPVGEAWVSVSLPTKISTRSS